MRALLLLAGCLGCTAGPTVPATDAAVVPDQALPAVACSVENITGTATGATLSIRSTSCMFYPGQTATFTYEMTIGDTSITIPADPPGGCGTCVHQTSDPMTYVWPTITDMTPAEDSHLFCPGVSFGCCAPHPELTFQLAAGTYSRTVEWRGRDLGCPSDTPMYEGEVFPPGRYAARARYDAFNAGFIDAQLPIEIFAP